MGPLSKNLLRRRQAPVNTRMIAIIALVIAVLLLLFLFVF